MREGGEWVARTKEARGLLEAEEKIAKIGSSLRTGSGRNGKIAQREKPRKRGQEPVIQSEKAGGLDSPPPAPSPKL